MDIANPKKDALSGRVFSIERVGTKRTKQDIETFTAIPMPGLSWPISRGMGQETGRFSR
jgi:hypothetical protein